MFFVKKGHALPPSNERTLRSTAGRHTLITSASAMIIPPSIEGVFDLDFSKYRIIGHDYSKTKFGLDGRSFVDVLEKNLCGPIICCIDFFVP
jgi:hypothetical protein